jgi:hypothetical protein
MAAGSRKRARASHCGSRSAPLVHGIHRQAMLCTVFNCRCNVAVGTRTQLVVTGIRTRRAAELFEIRISKIPFFS